MIARKILLATAFVIMTFAFFQQTAQAQESKSRKGFSFSLGIPGLGGVYHEDQDDGVQFSLAGDLRLGYGLNEKVVLFLESFGAFGPVFGGDFGDKGVVLSSSLAN